MRVSDREHDSQFTSIDRCVKCGRKWHGKEDTCTTCKPKPRCLICNKEVRVPKYKPICSYHSKAEIAKAQAI